MYDDSTSGGGGRPGSGRGGRPGIRLTFATTALGWAAGRWPGLDGELAGLRPVVRPGSVVLDLASTYGAYTWILSRLAGPVGSVHCFEPLPGPARRLTRSATALGSHNVRVHRIGIGTGGRGEPLWAGRDPGAAALRIAPAPGSTQVPMATVDDARRWLELDRVDFIRVDADGAEGAVLSGAFVTLLGDRPTLLLRIDPARLAAHDVRPGDLVRRLTITLGYRMYRWSAGSWHLVPAVTDDRCFYLFRARRAESGGG
ncbi:FkbM family methyltransferase [Streptomyces sp. MUM 16J]|uniref:FkbM family methyltransferase n=1 Tax=Streptomyces sp. MUM 16J TaxID=2791988 RepID=UPI001F04C73A|nr:FkbM family methyltransferase [Streptomyces sp. MUM 16J]MCH0561187.1 FkbM family methyltransferase [Streptomyces sp. MUM 16J]